MPAYWSLVFGIFVLTTAGCDKAVNALKKDPVVIVKNDTQYSTIGNFFKRNCAGELPWERIGGNIASGAEEKFKLKEGCYDFKAEMVTGQEVTWDNNELEKDNELTLTVFTDY